MIRRLRRQFILVAMLSTLAVLTVIIGVLNAANYISMNRKADMMLDLLAENGGMFPAVFMG
ncbi:MAG: two-component sensor histidine kinase, partial [Lachnospiraceae bacterium]|nr:two-component sensor histidine kinase [Lachnospiraceae bacterium]